MRQDSSRGWPSSQRMALQAILRLLVDPELENLEAADRILHKLVVDRRRARDAGDGREEVRKDV